MSTKDFFQLQVVTPHGVFATHDVVTGASSGTTTGGLSTSGGGFEEVTSVTIPTTTGEVQILPGHAEYVTLLGTGLLSYTLRVGGKAVQLIVSGGAVVVRPDSSVLIIADEAEIPRGDIGFIAARLALLKSSTEKDQDLDLYQKVVRMHAAAEEIEARYSKR